VPDLVCVAHFEEAVNLAVAAAVRTKVFLRIQEIRFREPLTKCLRRFQTILDGHFVYPILGMGHFLFVPDVPSYEALPEVAHLAARERPDLVNPVIERFLDQLPSLS
jgi:hypothetical protein